MSVEDCARMPSLRSAAVLLHPKIEQARQVADVVCAALDDCTLSVSRASAWDVAQLRELLPHVDVAITLGGDGSILRTSRIASLSNTPVLGINLGTLGFLAEMEPAEAPERIPPLVRGDYWVEERIMLQIEHWRDGERLGTYQALNEAVVGRRALSRVVRVPTRLNDQELTKFKQNGFVVSERMGAGSFAEMFYRIYSRDLPVFVSTDALLHAWHRTASRT